MKTNKQAEVVEPEVEEVVEEVVIEESATRFTMGFGAVTVVIDEALSIPERSGKMSPAEVKKIVRTPRGIGHACDNAADSLEKAIDAGFIAPSGVTPASLREAGKHADAIDVYIEDVEILLNTLKQGNLLLDAAAYKTLRRVNEQVKTQAKDSPEFNRIFAPMLSFFEQNAKHKTPKK